MATLAPTSYKTSDSSGGLFISTQAAVHEARNAEYLPIKEKERVSRQDQPYATQEGL